MWIIKRYDHIMAAEDLIIICSTEPSAKSILLAFQDGSRKALKHRSPQEVWVGKHKFIAEGGFSYSTVFVPKAEDL